MKVTKIFRSKIIFSFVIHVISVATHCTLYCFLFNSIEYLVEVSFITIRDLDDDKTFNGPIKPKGHDEHYTKKLRKAHY